ncbi:MAG: cytochrome c3 family protein [Nitrospirota bacterium]|nr:cytochrome c3 family protein [Nitrospirota bacterium]
MKKKLIIGLVTLLSLVLTYGFANALTGSCSTCHTMHDSQGGAAVATGGPLDLLLNNTCLGCHTSATGNTIISGTPIVYNSGAYPVGARGSGVTAPLAGGNFYAAASAAGDSNVHNVVGILAGVDGVLGDTPPGGSALAAQLTCAGTQGCHGNRSVSGDNAAIKGAHHANVAGSMDGLTIAKSYRFLGGAGGTAGVQGVEQLLWEQTATATNHNGYFGNTGSAATTGSISVLCAACHTNFHGVTGTGSPEPWQRHPTDIVLTTDTFTGYGTTYKLETPVALATPSTNGNAAADSRVICMSCHNAHGSTYADMLRFDYTTMNAGNTTNNLGCESCHNAQR